MSIYKMSSDLVLYGAGRRCERLVKEIKQSGICIKAIIDASVAKQNTYMEGIQILSPDTIKEYEGCLFCICIADDSIRDKILFLLRDTYGIKDDQIVDDESVLRYAAILKHREKVSQTLKKKDYEKAHHSIVFESLDGFGLGGIQKWTQTVANGIYELGHADVAVAMRIGEEQRDEDKYHLLRGIYAGNDRFANCSNIIDYLVEKSPCLYISSQPYYGLMGATVVKELVPDAIRIISVIHGGMDSIYKQYLKYDHWIDRYVAVSNRIKADLVGLGIDGNRIDVITCPFNYTLWDNRSYTVDVTKPIHLGYAGRFEYLQKRMDLIMRFIKALIDKNVNFVFELAGNGQAYDDLDDFIHVNHYDGKVKLIGEISGKDIPDFWKRQDIAINLSDFEGHSLSQLEAMAGGAVPIVTDVSGAEDDIKNGVNGFIVPLEDYKEAVEKVIHLELNRELLSPMGRKAYESVIEKGDVAKHLKYWEDTIDVVCNS